MRYPRPRVAHTIHTSHHFPSVLVYTDTPRISMVTIRSSIASCRERSRPQALGCSSNDAILAYLMYPNLRIALHCFCPTSLISNTPFLSVPRLFKSLRVLALLCTIFDHPYFARALITPAPLYCGMLCSRKHDYGQFLFYLRYNMEIPILLRFNRSLPPRASLTHACEKSH
jgi:hypothetical protein